MHKVTEFKIERFLNNIGSPVIAIDNDMKIVFYNEYAECLLGSILTDSIGKALHEVGCDFFNENGELEESPDFPKLQISKCLIDNKNNTFLMGLYHSSLEDTVWVKVSVTEANIHNKSSFHIILTITDVTDLIRNIPTNKQTLVTSFEKSPGNEQEKNNTTVDGSDDIVVIQNTNYEIIRANKSAHQLFGYKVGKLKGKKCYELFNKQDQVCKQCPILKSEETACPFLGLFCNNQGQKTFSVSAFHILNKRGKIRQFVHVARDVTKYLQNESEKNRLMTAIEQAWESVVITNVKGEVQYVNPAFESMTGYCRKEIAGRKLNTLQSGVHDKEFYKNMWSTLLSKNVWRGKLTNRRKDGTFYNEDATISPILNRNGQITNFVALKRDITNEEYLEKQLHQAMKMEALGTLAGGIAHDFNNILSAMLGYAEIAKYKLERNHPIQEDISQVIAGGERAVDLVKQILTFSKQESQGEHQLIRVESIVKEVIKLLGPSLPATIELKHTIDNDCGTIQGDPAQIYQVIMNLCTNAKQAIGGAHGKIEICLKQKELLTKSQKRNGKNTTKFLELKIQDTGCGIAKGKLDKIFDPFFTTKKEQQSTGLGLAVVHGIIQKHKGEIHVQSELGEGTTFFIYLAIDGRNDKKELPAPKIHLGNRERIMIVDDEKSITDVLSKDLERAGYIALTYNNSLTAVKKFREEPYCCDLVLTDMQMPSMTGAELSREFLALRSDLPIIMLSGYSENFNKEKAIRTGIKDYLLKPVRSNTLRQTIWKALQNG